MVNIRHFFIGLLAGCLLTIVIAGLILVVASFRQKTEISRFPGVTTTSAAAISNNLAGRVSPDKLKQLTVGLADSSLTEDNPPATDLISLEVTIQRAEAYLVATKTNEKNQTLPHWEVLNLTQPTHELFGVRGSRGLSELGVSNLLPGTYDQIRLVVGTVKGRRSTGQVVDVSIPETATFILVNKRLELSQTSQLVLDIDTNRSLTQDGTSYQFRPSLRGVTYNDEELQGIIQ